MKITLGGDGKVDGQELITGRTLLCSVTRYGKSWCARRISEKVFGHAGIGIIDLEGEYSTLLELYPFLIIGRDVPVEPEAAAFLADEILGNKLSFIIDGSNPDLDAAIFQEFITNFINRFIAIEARIKAPYLFILEEADQLIPEKGVGTSLCLEPLTRLVAKGGKRGLGTVIITQRPAFVSKRVISQATNKLIGHIEWPDDIAVLTKFGQIPGSADIKNLNQGDFYAVGPFIKKPQVIHIGSVKTTHLGATPSVVPPIPSELKEVVAQLTAKLPAVIEEMKPAIPKASEIEARLKEKFEEQWKVRLQRVEKQRDAIGVKTEAKYETEIADLKRKLDEAVRHATLTKGGVSDLLSHPLVKKNLEKLNAKQRGFVELLETKGSQDPERCSLFLEINPKSVPAFVYAINRKIPRLIENVRGHYVSRLIKLFPVTEEAKAEAKEIERLQNQTATLQGRLDKTIGERNRLSIELGEAERLKELIQAKAEKAPPAKPVELCKHVQPEQGQEPVIPVEVTLKRKLTDFKVEVDREVLTIDESTWEGKILARGLNGFFDEPKGIGKIMGELVRRYGVSASGGNRTTVNNRLTLLVSKGILDRKQEAKQWVYLATPEFRDRVKNAREAG